MATRSELVQLRVTPAEKTALRRLARQTGQSVSGYILSRTLPGHQARFLEILSELANDEDRSYVLAELSDFLTDLLPGQFQDALRHAELRGVTPLVQNYVAAMVEQASHQRGVAPPSWTRQVTPLSEPFFTTPMKSLRLHLLKAAPVPFKRRNIFVDSGIGRRV